MITRSERDNDEQERNRLVRLHMEPDNRLPPHLRILLRKEAGETLQRRRPGEPRHEPDQHRKDGTRKPPRPAAAVQERNRHDDPVPRRLRADTSRVPTADGRPEEETGEHFRLQHG